MYDERPMDELIGKTFTQVSRNDNEIIFKNDKETYVLRHECECCETVYIEDIWGDLRSLENAAITYSIRTTSEDCPKSQDDMSFTWTFFKFATINGWVDVRFYGSSNGYYSEDARLYKYE